MGYLYALLSALLFGVNGSVAKLVIDAGVTAAQLTFLRSFGGAIMCGLLLLAIDRRAFRPGWRQLVGFGILGLIGIAGLQWFYALAISRMPVGIALLIEYLGVPIVAVVAVAVFRERVRPRLWVGIALMLVGLAVVSTVWDSSLDGLGVVLAFLAALALAVYFIVGERGVRTSSPLTVAFWSMAAAAAFWALFSGWWDLDPELLAGPAAVPAVPGLTPPVWLLLLWTMALGSFVPFFLSYLALKTLGATLGGVLASSEVLFAFIAAWILLDEALAPYQLVGAAVVVAGIVLAQTSRPGAIVDAELLIAPAPLRD